MKKIVRVYLSTYIDVDIDKCEDFENDEEIKEYVTGYLSDFIDKCELDEHLCMEPTEVEVIDVNSEFDIEDYEWLDDMTWLCCFFAKEVHTETDDYQSKMVVEYHKDEDRWVVDEQFYNFDGEYIDHIILKDEALRDKYLGIAQKKYNEKKQYNYSYPKGDDNYIKCKECGNECLMHDGNYECQVCGNTGYEGEELDQIKAYVNV